jgi:hypothetical protein
LLLLGSHVPSHRVLRNWDNTILKAPQSKEKLGIKCIKHDSLLCKPIAGFEATKKGGARKKKAASNYNWIDDVRSQRTLRKAEITKALSLTPSFHFSSPSLPVS